MATIPLEVEKLLAVCWLILTGQLSTASRALIKFVYACNLCYYLLFWAKGDLKPIEVNFSLNRYSISSFQPYFPLDYF